MVWLTASASRPSASVSEACGSRSSSHTRRPRSARAAPRLGAVVVLPTPPFWLAIAMMRVMVHSVHSRPLHRNRADSICVEIGAGQADQVRQRVDANLEGVVARRQIDW